MISPRVKCRLGEVLGRTRSMWSMTLSGDHPDKLIQAAHIMCHSHFRGPWHFTSLKLTSPYQQGVTTDHSAWKLEAVAALTGKRYR